MKKLDTLCDATAKRLYSTRCKAPWRAVLNVPHMVLPAPPPGEKACGGQD